MQKIKLFYESDRGKDLIIILIIILLGISSFFLGRLSKESSKGGLKIEYTGQEASALGSTIPNVSNISFNPNIEEKTYKEGQGRYFASKRGKKYYPLGCSTGKTIKQENRIYFQTSNEAEKAGFSLASSC